MFTTRPDTLMGCTYAVLAPEHPLVAQITTAERRAAVDEYVAATARRSDRDRTADAKKKTGVPTGASAVHPLTGAAIPIWVADYVIGGYGTGAVMAVPAHDTRDFAFARAFGLPIVEVVSPDGQLHGALDAAYVDEGVGVQSGPFDGLATPAMKAAIVDRLTALGRGGSRVTYKLRDWVFSRQRYWGEPIPIYFPVETAGDPRRGDAHTIRYDQPIAVEESELPLPLPDLSDYRPGNDPAGPLARAVDWRFFQKDGRWFARETNTMPQWAGSCWYYLRFIDPRDDAEGWSEAAYDDWMPVDLYVGGAEHAVLHLLYARFWHKVLFDLGRVKHPEPFLRLVHQGMILGEIEYTTYRDPEGRRVDAPLAVEADEGWKHRETGAALVAVKLGEAEVQKSGASFVIKGEPSIRVAALAHKMSKSRGNVVNPDDIVAAHGADVLRLYEMFMGPLEAVKPWQSAQIQGIVRFRDKLWALGQRPAADAADEATRRLLHKTIKKVSGDIEAMSFNTAISAMMVLVNHLASLDAPPREGMRALALLVSPFAPHLGEELWRLQGHEQSLAHEAVAHLGRGALHRRPGRAGRAGQRQGPRPGDPGARGERGRRPRRGARRRGCRHLHQRQAGEEVHLRPGQDHQPRRRLRSVARAVLKGPAWATIARSPSLLSSPSPRAPPAATTPSARTPRASWTGRPTRATPPWSGSRWSTRAASSARSARAPWWRPTWCSPPSTASPTPTRSSTAGARSSAPSPPRSGCGSPPAPRCGRATPTGCPRSRWSRRPARAWSAATTWPWWCSPPASIGAAPRRSRRSSTPPRTARSPTPPSATA